MNRAMSAAIITAAAAVFAGYVLITALWYPYEPPDTDWTYRIDTYGTP